MPPGSQLRLALGFALAALLSLGAVLLLPQGGGGGSGPAPTGVLVAVASVVALACGIALYVGIRFELGLPVATALFAVGYNVLVVLVKFVLGPQSLYEASEAGEVTTDLGDSEAAFLVAAGLGVAYIGALWLLYALAKRQLTGGRVRPTYRWLLVAVVAALLLVSGMLPALLLIFAIVGGEYIAFVFSSSASLVAGAALAFALSLALLTMTTAAERARVVGNATLLASVFWLGAAFLALYHALWVVYIVVLTSIWPLKVVTSK